jgi:RNA polymerase sigma-70 factor (ECF subfamily)
VTDNVRDFVAEGFARGDRRSFEAAYQRYSSLVYTFCRRTVGDSSAADVAQEVFVTAWRKHGHYQPDRGPLGPWLMGIARHKTLDYFRGQRRVPEPQDPADPPTPGALAGMSPDAVSAIADQLLVADALSDLAPRTRVVIELAYFEDLTHEEIANRTGVPLGTVKSDIRRGLQRLRQMLEASDVS